MRLIIERYLIREIVMSFIAVSLLLVVMFFSTTLFRLLTETLEGRYPVGILFSMFALKVATNIVFILPFAFFLAVLLAFGRLYKDNEIVVLMACGAGPGRFYRSITPLAVIMAIAVGYLALVFSPWVGDRIEQLLDEAKVKQDIAIIVPGRFNSFSQGEVTVYVESFDDNKDIFRGVFVKFGDNKGQVILSADAAYERIEPNGIRYLVLLDGYRYEGKYGQRDYQIIHFAEHGILIHEREVVPSGRPRKAVTTAALWGSDEGADVAELHWRLAMPLSTILLALLAVPLSKSSPRGGRYAGLFMGVALYLVYNNLLIVGRSALTKGDVAPQVGLWWVHALVLVLLGLILWKQNRVRTPKPTKRPVV